MKLEITEDCRVLNESNRLLLFQIDETDHVLTGKEEIELYEDEIFEIKNHLIKCLSFINDEDEKLEIPTLWIREQNE